MEKLTSTEIAYIGIFIFLIGIILYTGCHLIDETENRDVDTREQPVKNKTVEIKNETVLVYRNGVMHESTAHGGKMLCTTWCIFSPGQGSKCFGQCIPNFIRNTK